MIDFIKELGKGGKLGPSLAKLCPQILLNSDTNQIQMQKQIHTIQIDIKIQMKIQMANGGQVLYESKVRWPHHIWDFIF